MRLNPTLALAAALFALFCGVLLMGLHSEGDWRSLGLLMPLQLLAFIAFYTVAHDAVHRIASRNRLLNEAMLLGCGIVFLFDPWIYRRLHLAHHAHPHTADDPDRFTASTWLPGRVARSAVLVVGYYVHAARTLWPRPRWRLHLVASPLMPLVFAACFAWCGRIEVFVILWLMPLAVGAGFLGFVLSSLPHDHELDQTRNLDLPRPICWLLGNGHLHLAHHRFPRVVWYRLPQVWRESASRNTPVSSLPDK